MRKIILNEFKGTQTFIARAIQLFEPNTEIWSITKPPSETLTAINKDLNRQVFIDSRASFTDIEKRWRDASKQKNYGYTQGDMTGGGISQFAIHKFFIEPTQEQSKQAGEHIKKYGDIYTLSTNKRYFVFGYINDQDEISGFALAYFTHMPHIWIASILKNATATHDKRDCALYYHGFKIGGFTKGLEVFTAADHGLR